MRFVFAVFCGLVFAGAPGTSAAEWVFDPAASALSLEGTQGRKTINVVFPAVNGTATFDPAAPEAARVSAAITVAGLTTGDGEEEGDLVSKNWFHAAAHPAIRLECPQGAVRAEGDGFAADCTVTVRAVSVPVTLRFTVAIDGGTARAEGTAEFSWLAFKAGAAEPDGVTADESQYGIRPDVRARFTIIAARAGG